MHEAEAAHVAVPVAAPAVGRALRMKAGRAASWPGRGVARFAPQASMKRCRSLRWSSRTARAWRRAALHDGRNR